MVDAGEFYFNVDNNVDAREKMEYISREDPDMGREEVPVHNRAGRPMTEREKEAFIEKAERHDYCQRWHICPPNGDELDVDEARTETRRVAHDATRDARSSSIAYAVHPGEDGRTHAHVLVAGDEPELRMDRGDIAETRDNAHQRMTERYQEQQREREQEQAQDLDRDGAGRRGF